MRKKDRVSMEGGGSGIGEGERGKVAALMGLLGAEEKAGDSV